MTAARVVLAGAHGHGRWHLANLRRLAGAGLVRLAGVCDLTPVGDEALDGLGSPAQSSDLAGLLRDTGAEIAILATPIHTHAELALTAFAAGAHVLLEKPPAATFADFERVVAGAQTSGRTCQVGFQSLGSPAVAAVRALIEGGAVGQVRGIGVAGSWTRDTSYFDRARWAGRRRLDGVDVVDGALTNPLAHALATALAVDGSEDAGAVGEIELELFHAFPIESDDTSCLRLRTARGTVITVAVTLCAPRRSEPYVVVHGDAGRITLRYTRDEVRLERSDGTIRTTTHPRVDLLENLVAHLCGEAELLVPPRRTGAFMRVLEAVRTAPDPRPIPADAQDVTTADGVTGHVVRGIEDIVAVSAERLALFSELGVRWADTRERAW
jgi:predicted dehydrogenase